MRYIGDDLINLVTISISPESGEVLPEIASIDVKIGSLIKHYDNPDNPMTINIFREDSIKLSTINSIYACIWYYDTINGQRKLLKKTCDGTITLSIKPEVINGGHSC